MGTVIIPTFEILTVELSVEILSINKEIPGGTCSPFNIYTIKSSMEILTLVVFVVRMLG